jgi:predicted MFS family arabinose efflux permease
VNSLYRLVGYGIGQPLGWVVVGLLLQRSDPRAAILASTAVLALMALAASLYRPVRQAPCLG